ncbi:hypothetical protein Glove_30g79 [Diversispora epigaea]|uniref:ATPase AAA-type core domain-containing protein n=1 Tax=Diversispora epigaea TaxID=1348612 RepID=A0A397JJN3_9GLOM|nr:hypothetical protein Glove_30g79 [Diversispora epigaea]
MEKGTKPGELTSEEDESTYYVICGEHGTRKTKMIRKASRDVGAGVIYVDLFGIAFGKALNFAFEEKISLTNHLARKMGNISEFVITAFLILTSFLIDEIEPPKWERAFKRAAKAHNKPPIIVYDNVSRLISENPKILDLLQNDAKGGADSKEYVTVFVGSEGEFSRRMECTIFFAFESRVFHNWRSLMQEYHYIEKSILNVSKNFEEYFYKINNIDGVEVLKSNVFAYHPAENVATFHSESSNGVFKFDLKSAERGNCCCGQNNVARLKSYFIGIWRQLRKIMIKVIKPNVGAGYLYGEGIKKDVNKAFLNQQRMIMQQDNFRLEDVNRNIIKAVYWLSKSKKKQWKSK